MLPVRADDQIEPRLGAILFAQIGKLIAARIIQRVDPESAAEVRHLNNNWVFVDGGKAETVDYVLIGMGDKALVGSDIVREHRNIAGRGRGQHAALVSWFGCPCE